MNMKALALAAMMAVGAGTAAHASLIGDTITAGYDFPSVGANYGNVSFTVNPFVVGAGTESIGTIDGFAQTGIDFGASSLVLSILTNVPYTPASMNGYTFIDTTTAFSGTPTVIASGGQSVSTFIQGGTLYVNWQGQSFSAGDTVTVNFSAGVPEASTWAMMLVGFAGLGYLGVSRKRAAQAA